ncbi:MAG: alpha/beta fold hydrolase [Bacilli bacterium]|nr:alpha/beta fold hydrolase [Bacilli bacterium]
MCSRRAVLIIHGLAGGTYDEEPLANFLEKHRRLDVFSFTLPGHDVKDKRKATMEEWINESERQLNDLIDAGYKKIYLIGHSMGGVIASYLASKYKQVKKLVLVAPAFTSIASKEEGGLLSAIFKIPDLIKAYSYNELKTRLNKLPLSAEKEFFDLVDTYKDDIYKVTVPTLFVHGTIDQVVPVKSTIDTFNKYENPKKVLLLINDYYHDVFKGNKVSQINNEIQSFLLKRNYRIKEEKLEI